MKIPRRFLSVSVLCAGATLAAAQTATQTPNIRAIGQQKISQLAGGFSGVLGDGDFFGIDVAAAGDLNGDGRQELVVCAPEDDDGGPDRGAVWILFLDAEGKVQLQQKISDTAGGFQALLGDTDQFGRSAVSIGDLDGDEVPDLVVGAYRLDDGLFDAGGVFVLFMNANGTVKAHQRISNLFGGFGGLIGESDLFGLAVTCLDDLDGDGVDDLAVGALQDDGLGGADRGAVWILLMNPNGTVKAEVKIGEASGGFTGALQDQDKFGSSVASLGDLDGDGVCDLAVGATGDDDGGSGHGAVWVLFLHPNGTVKAYAKISDTQGGFRGHLETSDNFGHSLSMLGDVDRNGRPNLAVGVWRDDDGGDSRGAVWILDLEPDGSVASHAKISDTKGGFTGGLDDGDGLGMSVGWIGDLDGDGTDDVVAGAFGDDDGGIDRGAAWVIFLDDAGPMGEVFPPDATKLVGAGLDPDVFDERRPARVGATWIGEIAASSTTTWIVSGQGAAESGPVFAGSVTGELLVLPPFEVYAGQGRHELAIPPDASLAGRELALQGAYLAGGRVQLTNGLLVRIGGALAPLAPLDR